MKVAYIDQSGQLGGAELMLLQQLPYLGADPQVILLEHGPFEQALRQLGIPVSVISFREAIRGEVTKQADLRRLMTVVPGVARVVNRVRRAVVGTDLIYANTPKAWVIGAMGALATGLPLVCHLHDILSRDHFSAANVGVLVEVANHTASLVIANSHAAAKAFVSAGGQFDKVRVIPNGFDLAKFDFGLHDNGGSLRGELEVGQAPIVAMAGRLAPWKGQHVFIEALAKLPGLHGVIVGEALFTAEDRRYAEGLPALASDLGCRERVHFLGFRDDVTRVFRAADAVVHCSVAAEPFGRVVVEGMLCRRPVVASNAGGPSEIIEDRVTGLLHCPGDAADLSNCLRSLLDDPERARQMAFAGETAAREKYDIKHVTRRTRRFLDSVLGRESSVSEPVRIGGSYD